jgi:hypothetical protein
MQRFLLTRPITILGILSALHSIVYGVGFIFGAGGFSRTVLYMETSQVMDPMYFGVGLLAIGLAVMVSFLRGKNRTVSVSSFTQSFIWFFATLIYWLNGEYLLGIGIALLWTLISQYVSYCYRHLDDIKDYIYLTADK